MNVRISWTPNMEADLSHYKVYWGPTTLYGNSQVTGGRETTMDILGLPDRVRTYFAVAAVNDSNDESAKSTATFAIVRSLPVIR